MKEHVAFVLAAAAAAPLLGSQETESPFREAEYREVEVLA